MPVRLNSSQTTTATAVRTPTAPGLSTTALNRKAVAWIKFNSGEDEGKKLPAIDSGNLGMSAFVPTPALAKALLKAAKEAAPGSEELQAAKLDPSKQRLCVVLTSDDEPAMHLCIQDKKTGRVTHVEEVRVFDLSEDGEMGALDRVVRGAEWLKLGEGSAEPNWWR